MTCNRASVLYVWFYFIIFTVSYLSNYFFFQIDACQKQSHHIPYEDVFEVILCVYSAANLALATIWGLGNFCSHIINKQSSYVLCTNWLFSSPQFYNIVIHISKFQGVFLFRTRVLCCAISKKPGYLPSPS